MVARIAHSSGSTSLVVELDERLGYGADPHAHSFTPGKYAPARWRRCLSACRRHARRSILDSAEAGMAWKPQRSVRSNPAEDNTVPRRATWPWSGKRCCWRSCNDGLRTLERGKCLGRKARIPWLSDDGAAWSLTLRGGGHFGVLGADNDNMLSPFRGRLMAIEQSGYQQHSAAPVLFWSVTWIIY